MSIIAKLQFQSGTPFKLTTPRIASSECSIIGTEEYIIGKIEELEGVIKFFIKTLHEDWSLDSIEYNQDSRHIEIKATLVGDDDMPEASYYIYLFTEEVIKHFFNCVNITVSIDAYTLDQLKEVERMYLSIADADWVDEE